MADTTSKTFAENVNHVAELDNSLGYELALRRSNIVLNENVTYSALTEVRLFNRTTNMTETVSIPSASVTAASLNTYLGTVKTALESAYPLCVMTHSVTQTTTALGTFNNAQLAVVLSGNSYYLRSINIKISEADGVQYDIDGQLVSPLEITPSMVAFDIETLSYIQAVAANESNINTVAANEANIDAVAESLANVNTIASIQNLANMTTVANDLNAMDLNGIADVTIVANNLVLGEASSINIVSANKANIDAVAANKTNIDAVAANEANINAVIGSAAATAADVLLTHADVALTHADVALTNADVVSADASANTATTQAGVATAKATEASASASAANASAIAAALSESQISSHLVDESNPHSVTKAQVGLGDVDNTSDINKPISTSVQTALNAKVDEYIINTDNIPNLFVGNANKLWTKGILGFTGMIAIELTGLYNQSSMNGMMNVHILEVSPVKSARIINISGQWNNGTSMWDYGFAVDLNSNVQMNARFARDVINEKVYILLGESTSTWNNTRISVEVPLSSYNAGLNLGFNISTLSSTSGIAVDILKAVELKADSAAITNALALKADLVAGKIPQEQLPSYVDDILEYANFASFPAVGESSKIYIAIDTSRSYRWSGSAYIDITGMVDSVAGKTGVVTLVKGDVGLGNVDNTADSAKPVSSAQQAALNLKANLASPTFTGTVSGITKSMVGLSNVDNTSDTNKPVSTAVQSALNLKQDSSTAVQKDSNTGAMYMPYGTTAQRPSSPSTGYMRFNTDLGKAEVWNGSVWSGVGSGATGGGADTVFVENEYHITTSYTIPAGKSAVSVGDANGDIHFNAGVEVTFANTSSRWVVL